MARLRGAAALLFPVFFGTELIDVSVGGAVLRVTGEGLTLKSMTEREVRIGGRIDGVEFLR